jgi:hypothetical protein
MVSDRLCIDPLGFKEALHTSRALAIHGEFEESFEKRNKKRGFAREALCSAGDFSIVCQFVLSGTARSRGPMQPPFNGEEARSDGGYQGVSKNWLSSLLTHDFSML